MSSRERQDSNERLILALQSGRQVAFDWQIAGDRLSFISAPPEAFAEVPLADVHSSNALLGLVNPEDLSLYLREMRRMLKGTPDRPDRVHSAEIRLKDGARDWLWVELCGKVVERDKSGRALRAVGAFVDIAARKEAEQRSARLRDLYAALSQTNQAILHMRSTETLFQEICRIAVECGHFQVAIIRMHDEQSQLLRSVAGYGRNFPLFQHVEVSTDPEKETGRGPSGVAFRDNRPCIFNSLTHAYFPQAWIDIALATEISSFASFPFGVGGKPRGVLILYSREKDFFDRPLIDLLEQMTQEISFALEHHEREAERGVIEAALSNSESFKDAILSAALDCIVSFDAGLAIIDFNPAAERTFGWRRADVLGRPFADTLFAPEARAPLAQGIARYLERGDGAMLNRRIESTALHAKGMAFPAEVAVAPIRLMEQTAFTATIRDISEQKQSQALLQDSEAHYRQLIDVSPEAIFVLQRGKFVLLNEACLQLFGAERDDQILGQEVLRFIHPDFWEKATRRALRLPMDVARHDRYADETWRRLDGSEFHAEVAITKFMYMGAPALQVVIRDITARRLAEDLQATQNRILSMITGGAALPQILETLAKLVEAGSGSGLCSIQLMNDAGTALYASVASSLPQSYCDAIERSVIGPGNASFGAAAFHQEPVITADIEADPRWETLRGVALRHGFRACASWPILGRNNKVLGVISMYYGAPQAPSARDRQLVGIATNLAGVAIENKESEDRILFLAHYDEMTALPNRALFNQVLNHAMEVARRHQKKMAVLFVDLDRFKIINDTFGHVAGDKTLQEIADRMRGCLRKADTVARMGGDEFYILLEELVEVEYAAAVAQKVLNEASRPFYIDEQECHLTASIGIAVYPDDGSDALTLLKNADIAMYRAKADGKNGYQFYSASKNIHTIGRLALESQLRRAIENREFVLHYQPKVDLASGRIAGVEALVRWQHPDLGLLSPNYFIPLAEETRLIVPLGKLVLRTACRDARVINARAGRPVPVAVNMSPRQIEDKGFLDELKDTLAEAGLEPYLLHLEITESMVMHNSDQAARILTELKSMGIRLDIDDFGIGYSSLAYLKRFPVYGLKIDRSFIQDIPHDPNDSAITMAIIAMGHSLGMLVVGEGVETAEQVEALRRFGCDEYQGYFFSRPLALEGFLKLQEAQGKVAMH
jgi:diguanylate cyclase (GGDEF)-like protein/PAS domain S-box-containing protein